MPSCFNCRVWYYLHWTPGIIEKGRGKGAPGEAVGGAWAVADMGYGQEGSKDLHGLIDTLADDKVAVLGLARE